MNTSEYTSAQGGGSSLPPLGIFIGGILCLHGLALAFNFWNYAGWWQLTEEQSPQPH